MIDVRERGEPELRSRRPGEKKRPPRICIFGKGGTGKTTLLRTMPGHGGLVETGDPEGMGDFVLEDQGDRIEVFDCLDWDGTEAIYQKVKRQAEAKEITWLGVDTTTGITHLAKTKTLRDRDRSLMMDPHTITLQEWGKIGQLVASFLYRYNTLPIPIIFLAQERRYGDENDEGGKTAFIGPSLTKSSLDALIPMLMWCGRLSALPSDTGPGWERRLRIGPSERFLTKARAINTEIEIPHQIRIGTPPVSEIWDITRYLMGRDIELDTVADSTVMLLQPITG